MEVINLLVKYNDGMCNAVSLSSLTGFLPSERKNFFLPRFATHPHSLQNVTLGCGHFGAGQGPGNFPSRPPFVRRGSINFFFSFLSVLDSLGMPAEVVRLPTSDRLGLGH